MRKEYIKINHIPAIIWGETAPHVYLAVHGQGGDKEDAAYFSEIATKRGCQVISIDLPEHGERKAERTAFVPWNVVPELQEVIRYAKAHWTHISLLANSIGAYFSLLSFYEEVFENALFVSPLLNMQQFISKMMRWADVSESRLKKEGVIHTSFGKTLSWEYWEYVLQHPVLKWETPTKILYGTKDDLVDFCTVEQFVQSRNCHLTVAEHAEHWFHTDWQLEALGNWFKQVLS